MDSIISVGLLPAMKYYDFQNPSPKAFIFPTQRFSPQIGQDRISQGLTEMVGKQAELNRCLRVPTHLSLSLATEQRAIIIISKEGGWESNYVLCQIAFVDVRASFSENSPLFKTLLQVEQAPNPTPFPLTWALQLVTYVFNCFLNISLSNPDVREMWESAIRSVKAWWKQL